MPTREEMAQALLIKRLRIVQMTRQLAPEQFEVRQVDGKLVLLQAGKAVVIGDPVTRLCYMV